MTTYGAKWQIRKRHATDGTAAWSRKAWPWKLTYPCGEVCLCLSYESAVAAIAAAQRDLRNELAHFEWMKRRYLAESMRAPSTVGMK